MEKAYALDANLKLKRTIRTCPGEVEHGQKHGKIEGEETAKTTVYTKRMVTCLVADIMVLAWKFFPSHSLVDTRIQPDNTNFVDVHFVGQPSEVALHALRLYKTSSLPKCTHEEGNVCLYLDTPEAVSYTHLTLPTILLV